MTLLNMLMSTFEIFEFVKATYCYHIISIAYQILLMILIYVAFVGLLGLQEILNDIIILYFEKNILMLLLLLMILHLKILKGNIFYEQIYP